MCMCASLRTREIAVADECERACVCACVRSCVRASVGPEKNNQSRVREITVGDEENSKTLSLGFCLILITKMQPHTHTCECDSGDPQGLILINLCTCNKINHKIFPDAETGTDREHICLSQNLFVHERRRRRMFLFPQCGPKKKNFGLTFRGFTKYREPYFGSRPLTVFTTVAFQ